MYAVKKVHVRFTPIQRYSGYFYDHIVTSEVDITIPRYNDIMHQSIETPAPQPPEHSGEFNIYPVLKDGLFPRPRGQETC